MRIAAHPGLYDPDAARPALMGSRCASCGATAFPAMTIGCEVCGAPEESLTVTAMAATGTVHSVATVHLHSGKDIEAPFTMAEVALDDGPLIRATLTAVAGIDLIGERVDAEWFVVRVDDAGADVVEPRFAKVAS